MHPGYIDTPLLQNTAAELPAGAEILEHIKSLHPIGHLGEPDDISYGVLYLASDASKYVTGSELVIDGGYTAQ